MKVASIPIGYSHGYSRSLKSGTSSHQGTAVYRCWFCKYEMTVDVTNLESVKKDDDSSTDWLSKRDFNINRFF
jgi:alanine racemase